MEAYGIPAPSAGIEVAFVGLVAATAGLLLYLVHAAYDGALAPVLGAGAYFAAVLGVTGSLGASGVLQDWGHTPPPFMLLMASCTLLTVGITAASPVGARLKDLP